MADLSTRYMDIALKNPVVVSSSGITGSIDGVKQCADAGAGALVLKSMFEELIIADTEDLEHDIIQSEHPEAYEYIRSDLGMQVESRPYLNFIGDARKAVDIPVFASVNCISSKWWTSYAKNIESAGAHGIELNISHFPDDGRSADEVERRYADIVREVAENVSIPVAVKIGPNFTSLFSVLGKLVAAGADALVLFNRYYSVDVDIEKRSIESSLRLSCPEEMYHALRWVGMSRAMYKCDIAATTGIHDTESIVKMLMMGATVTQVCSVLYKNGTAHVGDLVSGLESWLDDHGVARVDDIRGAAIKKAGDRDMLLKRFQYVQSLDEAAKRKY